MVEVQKSLDNCRVQINASCSVFFHYNETSENDTIYWESAACKYKKRTRNKQKKQKKQNKQTKKTEKINWTFALRKIP